MSARRTMVDVPVDNAQQLPVIEASGERGSWFVVTGTMLGDTWQRPFQDLE